MWKAPKQRHHSTLPSSVVNITKILTANTKGVQNQVLSRYSTQLPCRIVRFQPTSEISFNIWSRVHARCTPQAQQSWHRLNIQSFHELGARVTELGTLPTGPTLLPSMAGALQAAVCCGKFYVGLSFQEKSWEGHLYRRSGK